MDFTIIDELNEEDVKNFYEDVVSIDGESNQLAICACGTWNGRVFSVDTFIGRCEFQLTTLQSCIDWCHRNYNGTIGFMFRDPYPDGGCRKGDPWMYTCLCHGGDHKYGFWFRWNPVYNVTGP